MHIAVIQGSPRSESNSFRVAQFLSQRLNIRQGVNTSLVNLRELSFPNFDDHGELDGLLYYLERHIEVDGDEHGPAAIAMIKHLCDGQKRRWMQAQAAAERALRVRIALWDAIQTAIEQHDEPL